MQPRPIGNRLLVKVMDEEGEKERMWLPDGARSWSLRGVVIAAGDDVRWVEVADEVLFDKARALELQAPRERGEVAETLHLVSEEHVLCILDRVEAAA